MSIQFFGRVLVATALVQGLAMDAASAQRRPEGVVINRFEVAPAIKPDSEIKPGTKLTFTVLGTPKAKAFLTIPGATDPLPMKEVKPGVYQRAYTSQANDQYDRFITIRADLKRGNNTTLATLKPGEPAVTSGQGMVTEKNQKNPNQQPPAGSGSTKP